MSKISKTNKNGTLSIVLPKAVTENLWKEGDEILIENIGTDAILILRNNESCKMSKQAIFDWLNDMEEIMQKQREVITNIKSLANMAGCKADTETYRQTLKEILIYMMRKL